MSDPVDTGTENRRAVTTEWTFEPVPDPDSMAVRNMPDPERKKARLPPRWFIRLA